MVLPPVLRHWQVSLGAEHGFSEQGSSAAVEEYTGDGFSVSVERDTESRFLVTFSGLAAFSVSQAQHSIVCHPFSAEVPAATLEHLLLDQMVPRIIGQLGNLVLHAAGLAHKDASILLLGDTGRGKSTLATALYTHALGLLGDDAMVITLQDGRPMARAVYPSLRLLPDSRIQLLPRDTVHHPIGNQTRKERIALPFMALPEPDYQPIAGIFILDAALPGGGVSLCRLGPAEACMALTSNSFALDPADNRSASDRLQIAAALVRQAPAYILRYPRDYAVLPQVCAAIVDAVA
ncbi:MAG: hypothetical protein ABIW31_05930 [Novosphingobium sp.]